MIALFGAAWSRIAGWGALLGTAVAGLFLLDRAVRAEGARDGELAMLKQGVADRDTAESVRAEVGRLPAATIDRELRERFSRPD